MGSEGPRHAGHGRRHKLIGGGACSRANLGVPWQVPRDNQLLRNLALKRSARQLREGGERGRASSSTARSERSEVISKEASLPPSRRSKLGSELNTTAWLDSTHSSMSSANALGSTGT